VLYVITESIFSFSILATVYDIRIIGWVCALLSAPLESFRYGKIFIILYYIVLSAAIYIMIPWPTPFTPLVNQFIVSLILNIAFAA